MKGLTMLKGQQKLKLSRFNELYSLIIPQDHLLKQIKELVDFSFIYDELASAYSEGHGRGASDPIMLFKYLLLKVIYEISDEDVVKRTLYDMSFKYFLDLTPEETDLIHPSTLTKFRKLRLKELNLLDMLIQKTVSIAKEQGVLKGKTIIVDATHTKARYNQRSARDVLMERAKNLRKSIYAINPDIKEQLPAKTSGDSLNGALTYCQNLIHAVGAQSGLVQNPKIQERLNYLAEAVQDDLEQLSLSKDEDAKIGHKTADSSFFGYKSHLAMSEERIITAATITTGEKSDGKELKTLIYKSEQAGMEVEEVIADAAYSGKANLNYTKENQIRLVSKLNPVISQGTRKKEDEFEYNKDAGMFVCPAGHMAIRKARQGKKNGKKNQRMTYYFDTEKCKTCSKLEGCYKSGAKAKTYSITLKSDTHKEQIAFQESDYFKQRARERYKIEAKNSELKHQHGYDVASSSGLMSMQMQGAITIFAVNIKRIIKLKTM